MTKSESEVFSEHFAPSLPAGGMGNVMGRRTVTVFDHKLHTFTIVSGFFETFIRHNWLDLKPLLDSDAQKPGLAKLNGQYVSDGSNWNWQDIWDNIDGAGMSASMGSAKNANELFLVFRALSSPLRAKRLRRSVEGAPAGWSNDFILCRPYDGKIEDNPDLSSREFNILGGGAVSATFYGENQMLVAGTDAADGILLYLFDRRHGFDEQKGIWVARCYRHIRFDEFEYFESGKRVDKVQISGGRDRITHIDTDWFIVAPDKTTRSGSPRLKLAVSMSPESVTANGQSRRQSFRCFFDLPLKKDDSGEIDDRDDLFQSEVNPKADLFAEGLESGLRRDPAGRLRSFTSKPPDPAGRSREMVLSNYISTIAEPDPAKGLVQELASEEPFYMVSSGQSDFSAPASAFYMFEDGRTDEESEGKSTTTIPVLEFVLYGDGRYQVSAYGTIKSVCSTATLEPKNEDNVIIGGIFDGPVPFPVANFKGKNLGSDTQGIAGYVYGSEQTTERESASEEGWHAGIESEGHITEGFGGAWKFSLDGGMASQTKSTDVEKIDRELSVECSVENPAPYDNPDAQGSGMVSTLKAKLHLEGYQFIDGSGKRVSDALTGAPGSSPKLFSTLTSMTSARQTLESFPCFLVEPGNLESYTPQAINARMRELGYEGENYFHEVICRNAYPMGPDDNFLLYTWDEGSSSKTSFHSLESEFREQSWHLEVDAYVGVSGGEGLNVPLLGENFEWEILGGGGYEQRQSTSDLKENGWELKIEGKLNNAWGPEINDTAEGAVAAYSFRTYFLPVPDCRSSLHATHWCDELRDGLRHSAGDGHQRLTADMIDKGSGAWRILFVVTKIDYHHQTKDHKNYAYEAAGEPDTVLRKPLPRD